MQALAAQLRQLEQHIPASEGRNPRISSVSVGWHIAHSLLVMRKITEACIGSDPSAYRWRFSGARLLVFTFNRIPRGKGKAPKVVQVHAIPDEAALHSEVKAVHSLLQQLDRLTPKHHFAHPYFGLLHLRHTMKFLRLHTQHHLRIIDDIRRAG